MQLNIINHIKSILRSGKKVKGFAAGETVTLYYDPEDPEKMYVEGDRAVLGAEVLYFALAVVLVLLMAGFVR